jgi:MFS transporter, OFA family, oxalate/formate antiporter
VAIPGRWLQLWLGVVAMMAISSPQYVWTMFVEPFRASLNVPLAALQWTFALFSIFQCGFGPVHGHLAGRVSPRIFVSIGGMLVGLSWVASSFVTDLKMLYFTYGVLSGIGTGFVYVAVIELMVKYWPDRRGFAVGMVTGSYGFGAIVTTFPIAWSMESNGFRATLIAFGILFAVVIAGAALGMKRMPEPARAADSPIKPGLSPVEMLKTSVFWVMFTLMTMVAIGGLMVISQLGPFATSMGITRTTMVMGLAALPLALTIDRIANGVTRPFFGWISDRIGREPTMFIAFSLEAVGVFLLLKLGHHPVAFVLLSGLVFFGWGQIYALFPSLQADLFGPRYAVQNFGYLLVSTAVASVLGAPVAAKLMEATGSWNTAFYLVIVLDGIAAVLSLLLLAPMVKSFRQKRQGALFRG